MPTVLERILDSARWAPSGDNTQPWRFEILSDDHVVAHCFDTRDRCVYDLDGRPSQMAIGAMLETMAIAATHEQMQVIVERRHGTPETRPTFDLRFQPAADLQPDPLFDVIRHRSVQRRAMRMRALTESEKHSLEASVGSGYRVVWIEPFFSRVKTARLMFDSAKLRLTMPEAYRVHRDVIEWNARYSEDRVPDQALGIDALTMVLMKHVMHSWKRVRFFNRYLAGTLLPRLQMDLLPGIACAAHFVLVAQRPAVGVDNHVAAGRSLQRLWLTATALGLQMQPELTPLIFARYARDGRIFSVVDGMGELADEISLRLNRLIPAIDWQAAVFMGRVGVGLPARARSVRKPLDDLLARSGSAGASMDRTAAAATSTERVWMLVTMRARSTPRRGRICANILSTVSWPAL